MENTKVNSMIKELKEQGLTWQEVADKVNDIFNINLSADACRKRKLNIIETSNLEQTTTFGDGSKERTFNSKESYGLLTNREKLLKLKENPDEVELVWYQEKKWDAQTKHGIEEFYSIGYRVKPLKKEIKPIDYVKEIQDVFKQNIKPLKLPIQKVNKTLNNDLLMMLPAVEAHINKKAFEEVSEEYNVEIAKKRFIQVILGFIKEQELRKAGNCYITIGNDLLNSDTPNNTTTAGTMMVNDIHWKKAFRITLELYVEAILTLRKYFNKIDISLMPGNHDEATSFAIFEALKNRFYDDNIIKFDDSLKLTTHFIFGKNLIINNHGDKNIKKLVETIPSRFRKEWGEAEFVYLMTGHLHHDILRKNQNGITQHQLASISATDEWHENNNYVGALQQQQVFIFHKNYGKVGELFITFPKNKETIKK